ncbi:MAG: L-threonylcarbamoyladenylate synthase [Alphaproteobacteria bacterium]
MNEQESEPSQPPSLLREFAERLQRGEVIAFPTETFYGLLARIDQPEALFRLLALKGRLAGNPLPVIAADNDAAMALWSQINPATEKLIDMFWPGPLTLVLQATDKVPEIITANTDTVGVRVPGSAAARGVAGMADAPLVATSANPTGQKPAMSPADVRAYFGENVCIADGPELPASKGSTVVDMRHWPPVLLRDGDVARREIEAALGQELEVKS